MPEARVPLIKGTGMRSVSSAPRLKYTGSDQFYEGLMLSQ